MKKGIIVLLVAVLAAGLAFAGSLKGSASVSLGADFGKKTWSLTNPQTTQYNFEFEFDTVAAGKDAHETNVWAEIAAEAYATASIVQKKPVATGYQEPEVGLYSEVAITKANIHVGDFTISILGAGKTPDFVAHYTISSTTGKPILDVLGGTKIGDGVVVSYDGYQAGFATNGNWNQATAAHYFAGWATTKAYEVAEGVTVQAGLWGIAANDNKFGGSVKAAYAAEKLSADAAADLMYDNSKVAVEAAANAKYDFVTANIYFATVAADDMRLDAKVAAKYDFNLSDVVLKTTGSVEITEALKNTRELTVAATEETTIDAVTITLGETYKALSAKTLNLSAKVSCTVDKFAPYAQANLNLAFAAEKVVSAVGLEAGVTTKTLVENCELSLIYKNTNVLKGAVKGYDTKDKVNTLTAAAKIAF